MSSKPSMTVSFSAFLDIVRALAAIAVFLNHLRSPLFTGFPYLPPDQQTYVVRIWFFVTGFGFEAVIVFFVLSGFLVGGLGVDKIRGGSFNFQRYAVDRLSRLFVVLIPALFITVLFDYFGNLMFPSTGLWTGVNAILVQNGYGISFLDRDSIGNFLCNLGMLQSFYCPVLGSNIPLWTLSYEFWFYAIFGCFSLALVPNPKFRFVALSIGVGILLLLGQKFVWMLIVWIFGIAVYMIDYPALRRPVLAIITYLGLATLSRLMAVGEPRGDIIEIAIILGQGAAFAWIVLSFKGCNYRILESLSQFGGKIAGFSYTLYLVHFPLMLLVVASLAQLFGVVTPLQPRSATGVIFYVSTFLIVMFLAWLIALLTEAKTHRIRAFLMASLNRVRTSGSKQS